MRGIGHTLSRLPSALAVLAGVAILTGAFTSAVHGQTSGLGNGTGTVAANGMRADEVAWAVPQVRRGSTEGATLPQPLGPGDAAIARRVFALQAGGDMDAATRAMSELEDPLLWGTFLADRYLGRRYRASAAELSVWLARYEDLPDAPAIHDLLAARLPKGSALPEAPTVRLLTRPMQADLLSGDVAEPLGDLPRDHLVRKSQLDSNVMSRADRGDAASALGLIAATRDLSPAYTGQLRAEVAQVLFTKNEDVAALAIAQAELKGVARGEVWVRNAPALGFYIGGLAAWRLGRVEVARDLFAAGANAVRTTPRVHAASAFWASRASRALQDAAGAAKYLRIAAAEQLTLHGLLARRLLRVDGGFLPGAEVPTAADIDAVAATVRGLRAFALLQVGQPDRAEAEVRGLWPAGQDNPAFERSLQMVAAAAGLTDCAAQMAALLDPDDRSRRDALRLAVPRLRPAGGFSVDPTLVYAVTRIESNFDADAVSPAGARGLMQIMPATAQYITGDVYFTARRLHEPSANLAIGQQYIAYLARQDGIDNDLMRVLASYNAGPANFARWGADIRDHGDPLLFIEAIPVPETRAFVPHALMYSWIYAARMHLPADSLESLASGAFPRFTPRRQERRMALMAPDLH